MGKEYLLEFFQGLESRGQGLNSQGQGLDSQGQDQGLQNCPRGRALVLEDSNTLAVTLGRVETYALKTALQFPKPDTKGRQIMATVRPKVLLRHW